MLCQSECACLHKTINMVVFFLKTMTKTYPKGRALMQMYRVVPQTKKGNYTLVVYAAIRTTLLYLERSLIIIQRSLIIIHAHIFIHKLHQHIWCIRVLTQQDFCNAFKKQRILHELITNKRLISSLVS